MNNEAIRWQTVPRDLLPEVLLSGKRTSDVPGFEFLPLELPEGTVAVGFPEIRLGSPYNPPCVLIIGAKTAAETLSWLRVYGPETWPLSQFARVVSIEDWRNLSDKQRFPDFSSREDIWASIILGEAIAQGEADVELAALPLSRALGCFSMAAARAACTHVSNDAIHTCAERLKRVEADRRFVRRPVSVNDLLPIWSIAGDRIREPLSAEDAVDVVVDAALRFLPNSTTRGVQLHTADVPSLTDFSSDSIEERVLAFHKLVSELVHGNDNAAKNGLPSVVVASAAFLVGRGTSHEFLLHRVAKAFPAAPVWFGLIAALAGPATWDSDWSRAAKGVERQVRSSFSWTESSGFDLCWPEFIWIASTFDSGDIFTSLPKLSPRVLSVEVLPGATCQFRLAAGNHAEAERPALHPSARERDLQAALSQFIALAARTSQLLDDTKPPVQGALSLEGGYPTKGSRPKKRPPGDVR